MIIYVIRHGQTELNVQHLINGQIGDALTDEGKEQAKQAVQLIPATVQRIYSSTLNRAKQTAEILNEQLQLPLTFHDELMEVNFGVLNGTPYEDAIRLKHEALEYDWKPSGEDVNQVKDRVLRILKIIRSESGDQEALIVAHGGIIRMLTFLESGERPDEIANASIHIFDIDKILNE